jgi:hypothetical protein
MAVVVTVKAEERVEARAVQRTTTTQGTFMFAAS